MDTLGRATEENTQGSGPGRASMDKQHTICCFTNLTQGTSELRLIAWNSTHKVGVLPRVHELSAVAYSTGVRSQVHPVASVELALSDLPVTALIQEV